MNTGNILKWAVILVIGYVALRWFTSLLSGVIGAGSSSPSVTPYAPGGYVYAGSYAVRPWAPYTGRGRGPRWTYGGR